MEYRDESELRKARFFEKCIGNRTREELANELYGVYLTCRANHLDMPEDGSDPWPEDLHLADVIEKYVLRSGWVDDGHPTPDGTPISDEAFAALGVRLRNVLRRAGRYNGSREWGSVLTWEQFDSITHDGDDGWLGVRDVGVKAHAKLMEWRLRFGPRS